MTQSSNLDHLPTPVNPFIQRMQAMGVTPRLDGESTKDYLKRVDLYYHYLLSGRLPA